jgi:two-component system, OmpR family, sensor histidine kinase BaeS
MKYRPGLRVYLAASHLVLVLVIFAFLFLFLNPLDAPDQLLAILLAAAVCALILALVLSAILGRSLKSAARLASQMADGEYSQRLAGHPGDPSQVKELTTNLNRMADTLKSQQQTRQTILANVTHELARPIGALRLGVDSLLSGALQDPEIAEDLLSEMRRTLVRMEALVDDLAIAARPAAQPIPVNLKCIPPQPLLFGLRSRFWLRAEARQIDLQLNVPEQLPPILADELRLNQMIANLVDNAIKYTPVGGKVLISACLNSPVLRITIQDNGPGIPEEELPHITEPFVQGRNLVGINQGMGLGLSIVRQLAEAHQASLDLHNNPGGGLSASISLNTCV